MKLNIKNILKVFILFALFTSNSLSKEIKEPIKLEDINDLGSPIKIKFEDLPEGMQKLLKKGCNGFKCMHVNATKIMAKSFSRSEKFNNKNPDNMIKAMAHYEIFYLGQLYQKKKYIKKYKDNYKKVENLNLIQKIQFKDAEKSVRALIGNNKGRKSMREALGMSIELDPITAIKRFWYLGELLGMGQTTKNNVSSDMQARAKIMKKYNNILAKMKIKLEEKKDKKNKENLKN